MATTRRGFMAALPIAGGVALLGAAPTGASTQIQSNEWVSVRDFGAVGDGVTDDTGSLQAAIDSAGVNARGLLFPDGNYRITRSLVHAGNGVLCMSTIGMSGRVTVRMEGSGDLLDANVLVADGIFFKHTGSSGRCLLLRGDGSKVYRCTFANVSPNASPMIVMHRSNHVVQNCFIENNSSEAFSMVVERSSLGMCINGSIESNQFYGVGQGVQFTSTQPDARPEGWLIAGNKFVLGGRESVLINSALHISVSSNVFDQVSHHAISLAPTGAGIDSVSITDNYIATPKSPGSGVGLQTLNGTSSTRHLKVIGNHFELCGYGMVISSSVQNASICSNTFDNIAHTSLYLAGAHSASIVSNIFRGANLHLGIENAGGPYAITSNSFDKLGNISYDVGARDRVEFSANTGIKLSGWSSVSVSTAQGGNEAYVAVPHGLPYPPNPGKLSVSVAQVTGGHMRVSALIHGFDATKVVVQLFFEIAVRGELKVNLYSSI